MRQSELLPCFEGIATQPAYRIGIVENEERNPAIIYEARRAINHGLTVMILFKQIAHGKVLKQKLDALGISNELLIGADDQAERKRAINLLKEGENQSLAWLNHS